MFTAKQRAYYKQVQKIITAGLKTGDGKAAGNKILACRKAAQARGLTLAECKRVENEAVNTTELLYAYAAHTAGKA